MRTELLRGNCVCGAPDTSVTHSRSARVSPAGNTRVPKAVVNLHTNRERKLQILALWYWRTFAERTGWGLVLAMSINGSHAGMRVEPRSATAYRRAVATYCLTQRRETDCRRNLPAAPNQMNGKRMAADTESGVHAYHWKW